MPFALHKSAGPTGTRASVHNTFTMQSENMELTVAAQSRALSEVDGRFVFGEECWSDVAGYRMRYLRAGSGPPLVLIHGLLGYSFSWRFNWEVLAEGFTVYAVDLLGIGYSDRPPVGAVPYDLISTADRMLVWMEQIGIRDAILVGTSHGGGLALMMAAQDQRQKRGLIQKLVSIAGVNPWTTRGHRRARIFSHPAGVFILRLFAPMFGMARLAMLERMYGDSSRITEETLEGYRKPLLLPRSLDYGVAIAQNWRRDLSCLLEAIREIGDLPVFLIWGRKDPVVPVSSGRELKRHLRNAWMAEIDGVGHLPYEEEPEQLNRILLEYLRR